ncbi:MAG: hypothetical protein J6A03_10830 [Lachnospiraceae bacterium]|nr:hypothetical protein [Lachnospiraceae bacterium]
MKFKMKLKLTYYRLKGIGILALVPFVYVLFCVPVINYSIWSSSGSYDMLYDNIILASQNIIPFFSVWNSIFLLFHFVEQSGNEVLYIDERNKFTDIVMSFLPYIVCMIPLFAVYSIFFRWIWMFFIKVSILCFAWLMLVYALTFLFGNISIGFICAMVISIVGVITPGLIPVYVDYRESVFHFKEYFLLEICPYAILALLFFLVGKLANDAYQKYV